MDQLDEGQQVLHLRDSVWHRIPWDSWLKFRDTGQAWAPLPHVGAGEHHFAVCIVEDGRLFNIIPHRYRIDGDGRIADDRYFGALSDDEIRQFEALNRRHYEYPQTNPFTEAEERAFDALRDRIWRSWLPPAEAVRALTLAATALPDESDAAWHVLEASGIMRVTSRTAS
ncbi:hypothetical protein [Bradyrhizobium pachyrhizi]|uniref:hypothetical protein n=1 Tax=Bradyrhizobium pachyrhizi TaxID=280333 RepID=UPI003D364794